MKYVSMLSEPDAKVFLRPQYIKFVGILTHFKFLTSNLRSSALWRRARGVVIYI
jgi:hypothetical protein